MKTPKFFKSFIIIGILFLNFFLISCGSELKTMKGEFTESKNAIPSDFGKSGSVLVVKLVDGSYYDKLLKSCINDNYKGEVVFVKDDSSDTYSDKNKYKYLFNFSDGKEYVDVHKGGFKSIKKYYIQDRATGKMYQSNVEYKSYRNAIIAYMQNLEAKRVSNL